MKFEQPFGELIRDRLFRRLVAWGSSSKGQAEQANAGDVRGRTRLMGGVGLHEENPRLRAWARSHSGGTAMVNVRRRRSSEFVTVTRGSSLASKLPLPKIPNHLLLGREYCAELT